MHLLPKEREILSELRRRETWIRWGEMIDERAFQTRGARLVRSALERLHGTGTGIVSVGAIQRLTSDPETELEDPLPAALSIEKVGRFIVTQGVLGHLSELEQRLEQRRHRGEGEDLDLTDLEDLENWLGVLRNGKGGESAAGSSTLTAPELLRSRIWEQTSKVPTLLHKGLDDHLGGGVSRGSLASLQGTSGGGKSTLGLLMALGHALSHSQTPSEGGDPVLFFSCENYLTWVGKRLDQMKRQRGLDTLPDCLVIHFQRQPALADIHAFVRDHPGARFMFFDYFGKIRGTDIMEYGMAEKAVDSLRDVAGENDMVIWTANQEHDSLGFKRQSSRSAMYGSKSLLQVCDLVLGVHTMPRQSRAVFTIHKSREEGIEGSSFRSFFDVATTELRDLHE